MTFASPHKRGGAARGEHRWVGLGCALLGKSDLTVEPEDEVEHRCGCTDIARYTTSSSVCRINHFDMQHSYFWNLGNVLAQIKKGGGAK